MIANYHTHTTRCNHAVGTEIEYIECAIEGKFKLLGFSDHAPQVYPGDYVSGIRMLPQDLPDYVHTLQALKSQFADKLDIHIGLEAEYYPALFHDLRSLARDNGIEYMIMGQHWCGNEIGQNHLCQPTADAAVLKQYCHQVLEGLQSGAFSYLAHPDVVRFNGSEQVYKEQMRSFCKELKACDIPLEWNLLGMRTNRHYPNMVFWEIAAQENCSVVLGVDAHSPQALLDVEMQEKAESILLNLGLTPLENVTLHRV